MNNFKEYILLYFLKLTICVVIACIVIGVIEIFKGINELEEQLNEMIFEQEYINFCIEDSKKQSDTYESI